MPEQLIARRNALKYFGLLAGTAAGREFLAAWLPSGLDSHKAAGRSESVTMPGMHHVPPPDQQPPYVARFFKPQEFETVNVLTEIIIPTDETPGAREARVADYIDFVVWSAAEFKPSLQREWTEGLVMLDRLSKGKYGAPFREISTANRESLLTEMSLPEREPAMRHEGFEFYRLLKEMTVEAFYSSRVGLIDVLDYKGLAFLSEFPGCTHPEHQS